jgi:hypothetical protein
VLYEAPQASLIAGILACALQRGGMALVSDPGRRTAPALVEECTARGLQAHCVDRVPAQDAGADLTVSVYEIRWD